MSQAFVILNPAAGRGYAAKMAPQIRRYLTELGVDHILVQTTAPGHATELARQAMADGYALIVSAGGDGTTHEVLNGMMAGANGGQAGTLACIPAGSGNDFAAMNGVPEDIRGACELLAAGGTRVVDVGRVTIDGTLVRYFDNVVGIGFDGVVNLEARKITWLRGMLLYLPVVLKAIFQTLHVMDVQIEIDGRTIQRRQMMTVVANGPREGHTFLVAPHAQCDDGHFDLLLVDEMPRLSMLGLVPAFLKGTHLKDPRTSEQPVKHVIVSSQDPIYLHVDGEVLCPQANVVEVEILPGALRMIGRPQTA